MRPLCATLLLAGCLEPATGETSQAIDTTTLASTFQTQRAIAPFGCGATRFGYHFALTSLYCVGTVGVPGGTASGTVKNGYVNFYTSPSSRNVNLTAQVVADPIIRPGANANACRSDVSSHAACSDGNGTFADIALLDLTDDGFGTVSGLDGPQVVLPWTSPTSGASGQKVGNGWNSDVPNGNNVEGIYQVADTIDSGDDSNGLLPTDHEQIEVLDEGGPFYVAGKQAGVLHTYDVLYGGDLYTSTHTHLDWLLTASGYHWPGAPSIANIAYTGTIMGNAVFGTEQVCQYACENTSGCAAYDYETTALPASLCHLYSNVSGVTASTGVHGALRWGQSSGRSNLAMGYDRGDGHSVVIHKTTDAKINEILDRASGPTVGSLFQVSPAPPAVAWSVSGYRRADGVNAVVYRASSDNSLVELHLVGGTWQWQRIGTSAPFASSDPVAYTRADGRSAIVYRAGTDIIELRHGTGNNPTHDENLMTTTGCTAATSAPSAFLRSDGYASVTYIGGGQVRELFKAVGGAWGCGSPSFVASAPAPDPTLAPYGYTRPDGANMIVYTSALGHVILLKLTDTWHAVDITGGGLTSLSTPIGFVRADGTESVVYRHNGDIVEVSGGVATTLTRAPLNAPPSNSDPTPYIRLDGVTSIIYSASANHVIELYRSPTSTSWSWRDLTSQSSESP